VSINLYLSIENNFIGLSEESVEKSVLSGGMLKLFIGCQPN
jgi:hypothetical protein